VTVLSPTVDCIVDAKAEIAESPVWCAREQALYWVDITGPRLNRYDPATGKNLTWTMPAPIGSFALRAKGGFLLALKTGLHFFDPGRGPPELLVDPEPHLPDNRLNEGKCDRAGAFWVGSMKDPIEPARSTAAFYRLAPDRRLEKRITGVITSNGLGFSPDNRILYHSDSHRSVRTVFAYDHDPADGTLSNRRVFIDTHGLDGRPDGCAIDAEGCYWMAAIDSGSFKRFTPGGKLDLTVKLPVKWPTMPAFGGSGYDTLYFTSLRRASQDVSDQPQAGGVFVTRIPGVKGLPEPMFAG
jgi:sugar lactone lactonase YvrE